MARIVLVADDSPTIQKRAIGLLKGDGYEVETVSNGVAAIKRLSAIRPVVILADVCMPGRDGYEVCELVKKTPEFSHIPVVLITSDMEPYDSARGTAVKADGILKKPFEGRELLTLVERLAEQCESAAPSVEEVSIAPLAAAESASAVGEIELAPEAELTPTLVTAPAPDFSAHASGVAFAEPDESPDSHQHAAVGNFSFSPQADDTVHSRENDFEFPTLHTEEPARSSPPTPAFDSARAAAATPSFLEAFTAPSEHPAFLGESPATQAKEIPAAVRTAIFPTPPDLSAPPQEESASAMRGTQAGAATGLEPQFISEDLDVSALGDHGHSHPHSHDHDHDHDHAHDEDAAEHVHAPNPLNATNLGSFSLDAAAAGHIRFHADVPEVIYADESAEASALAEPTVPEKNAVPEVVYAEASSEEEALRAPVAEAAVPAPETSDAVTEAPEAESTPAPEVVYASGEDAVTDAAAIEPVALAAVELESESASAPEVGVAEIHEESADEVALAPVELDEPKPYQKPEVSVIEPIHLEPESAHEEIAILEAANDTTHEVAAEVSTVLEAEKPAEAVADEVDAADLKPEAAPERVPAQPSASAAEPLAASPAAPTPEPVISAPVPTATASLDSETIYSIVHKVVGHMAPSFLGDEAKADMAKRLAEKIAAELLSEKSS